MRGLALGRNIVIHFSGRMIRFIVHKQGEEINIVDLNISVKQTQLSELKGLFFTWC